MGDSGNLMVQNRSTLKEFISSISMMSGDLSNITAPPFVLDTKSTVELPQYWADHPSIFCAPAKSSDPAERAMLVLRWYLSSLRNQNYMGRGENDGVKKPLNAFLGELFVGKYEGEGDLGETRLVGEQVSHHPPITACRVWNESHGVIAEGYTRQTITFGGNVTIVQTGHALFTLTKHDNEAYLIPLPTLKVRGILTGSPYPELGGKYYIPSTSGYTSVIDFSGKNWFSGRKNSFAAKVYREDEGENNPVYTIKGQWNGEFVIHDIMNDEDIETFDVTSQPSTASKLIVDPVDEQDPWESRRAWKGVIDSLNRSDMKGTVVAKNQVEQGQRNMRKDDERENRAWNPVFFRCEQSHPIAAALEARIPGNSSTALETEKKETLGVWVFESEKFDNGHIQKPYHGELVPDNSHSTTRYSVDEGRKDNGVYSHAGARNSEDSVDRRHSSVSSIYSHTSSRRSSMFSLGRSSPKEQSKRGSPLGSARASVDVSRPSGLGVEDMSSLRDELAHIAKEQPAPQNQQTLRLQEQRGGSGVPGMSVREKANVEDFLRAQVSNQKA